MRLPCLDGKCRFETDASRRAGMTSATDPSDAIAYLKRIEPGTTPALDIPSDQAPVVTVWSSELAVAYVVDLGEQYSYVQKRLVDDARLDIPALHEIGVRNLRERVRRSKARVVPYGNIFV